MKKKNVSFRICVVITIVFILMGSNIGQHHFAENLVVREEQENDLN